MAAETQVELSQRLIDIVSHSAPLSQRLALNFFQRIFSDSSAQYAASSKPTIGYWDFVYGNDMQVLFDILARLISGCDDQVGSAKSILCPLVSCLEAYLNWPDLASSISSLRLSEISSILSHITAENDPYLNLADFSCRLAVAFPAFVQSQSRQLAERNFEIQCAADRSASIELHAAAHSCIRKISAILNKPLQEKVSRPYQSPSPDSINWKLLPFKPTDSIPDETVVSEWVLRHLDPYFSRVDLEQLDISTARYLLIFLSQVANVKHNSDDAFVANLAGVLLHCSGHGLGQGLGVGPLHPLTHLIDLPRLSVFSALDSSHYHSWFSFLASSLLVRLDNFFDKPASATNSTSSLPNLMSSHTNHITLMLISLDRLLASASARSASHLIAAAEIWKLYFFIIDLQLLNVAPDPASATSEGDIEFESQCHDLLSTVLLRLTLNIGLILLGCPSNSSELKEYHQLGRTPDSADDGSSCPIVAFFRKFFSFSTLIEAKDFLRLKNTFFGAFIRITQPPQSQLAPIDSFQLRSHFFVYIADTLSALLSRSHGDIDQFYCELLNILLYSVQISPQLQLFVVSGLSVLLQVKHSNAGALLRNERSPFASALFLCLSNGFNRSKSAISNFIPGLPFQVVSYHH